MDNKKYPMSDKEKKIWEKIINSDAHVIKFGKKEKIALIELVHMAFVRSKKEGGESERAKALPQLHEIKALLDWIEEHEPDIFYKVPCEWQDEGENDNRCGGHLETETNAWICGKEDECPLHWGAYGLVENMRKGIEELMEDGHE